MAVRRGLNAESFDATRPLASTASFLGGKLLMVMLLWLMMPAHLLAGDIGGAVRGNLWPIPIVASIFLVILMWLLGGVGSGRIHPL